MVSRNNSDIEFDNLGSNLLKRTQEADLFTRRFGSFSKSDYEILMFTVFLDSLPVPLRDYDISIALGITESKVRSLRVKSQLMYPRNLEWTEELTKSIEHGYYDRTTGQITVTFEDPSIQNLMKNKIEENFGTVGQTLNTKQLVLPIESFLLLAALAEQDESVILAKLNAKLAEESAGIAVIEKKQLKERFMNAISDPVAFVSSLMSIYSAGRPIIEAVLRLIS
jgi:hypothetical protein